MLLFYIFITKLLMKFFLIYSCSKVFFAFINIAFFIVGATSDAENLFRSWPLPCCSTNWWQCESDICPFKADTSKSKQMSYLFCTELHFYCFLTLYQALQNSSKLFKNKFAYFLLKWTFFIALECFAQHWNYCEECMDYCFCVLWLGVLFFDFFFVFSLQHVFHRPICVTLSTKKVKLWSFF